MTRKTHNEFVNEVYDLVGYEYYVLGEYINTHVKIEMIHNICKHIWNVEPNAFLRGNRCPICFGTPRKTTEQFRYEIYNLVGDEYIVLGEYIRAFEKIKMKHIVCNHIWDVEAHSFLRGRRCPKCKLSKGEKRIESWLIANNINYNYEHPLPNCKNVFSLPFDFYLPDYNLAIEYDGILHFEDKFNNPKEFKKIKNRDRIKTKYCKTNNISLLRIPYWEFKNIEKMLSKTLSIGIID